jgi:hypothetical protein
MPSTRRGKCWDMSAHTWKSFDDIFTTSHAHDGYTGYFANPSFQISIVRSHDIDLMSHDSVDDAVISVCALVATLQSFPSFISCNS